MPARTLALLAARDPTTETIWRDLEARADPPYFLSWAWVDHWLANLPLAAHPDLAVIRDAGEPIAACFLARRREWRRVFMTSNVLHVNATGIPRHDELCIEHNGLLAAPGAGRSLRELVALLPGAWDEVALDGVDQDAFDDLAALRRFRVRVVHQSLAPFVELDRVRAAGCDYAAVLGASTRAQLRKARRKVGRLDVEIAHDEASATSIFDELVALHSRRWQARGLPGAFADPWFTRFHRGLVASRMRHGEILLVRVRAEGRTLGCVYNFVYRGRVLFYQCGFEQLPDPNIRPGYLCHAVAIEHAARAGHAIYDLLGGGEYKERLGTAAKSLVWLRVQRPRLRFTLEDYIVDAKRRSSERIAAALGERNLLPWPGNT